jgi:acyl carrier protein
MTDTLERLSTILKKDYQLAPEQLTLEAPLESLGIDSLGRVELLWNIEDTFQIKLPSDAVELATLGDVVRYVDELVSRQAPGSTTPSTTEPALRPK